MDFQISNSLIWALSWFIDIKLNFSSMLFIDTFSFLLVPFSILNMLFWTSWIDFKSPQEGSSSVHLTLPYSCRSYLILDMKIPSTSFSTDLKERWLLILLMMNNLLFKADIKHPFQFICTDHCWLSWIVQESGLWNNFRPYIFLTLQTFKFNSRSILTNSF